MQLRQRIFFVALQQRCSKNLKLDKENKKLYSFEHNIPQTKHSFASVVLCGFFASKNKAHVW